MIKRLFAIPMVIILIVCLLPEMVFYFIRWVINGNGYPDQFKCVDAIFYIIEQNATT
jgi:hypothetical protein